MKITPTPIPAPGLPNPNASDLSTWAARMQELVRWMTGDNAPGMNTLGSQTLQNAEHAEDMAELAQGVANLVGAWSDLTGALSKPAAVSHSGGYWVLLNDLADVTASEPGVSADWALYERPSAEQIDFDGSVSGLAATRVQSAIDELALRGNLCDNPHFFTYTREVLAPAVFEPVTLTAGQFLVDRWKAGAGGFSRSNTASPVSLSVQIATGTLVHQLYQWFVAGDTVCIAWDGTAQARFAGGSYSASPIVHTFGSLTVNPSLEFSGNGTNFSRVRIHRGAVDLGCDDYERFLPKRDYAHFAQFYQRLSFQRQWVASAGELDRTTMGFSPMVVAPTASVLSTAVNTNVTAFSTSDVMRNSIVVSVTATAAAPTHRASLIALDTGF